MHHRQLSEVSVEQALQRMAALPGCLLLESVKPEGISECKPLGRYSFLMADPFDSIVVSG